MTKGDILFTHKGDLNKYSTYFVYDRYFAIGAGIWGIRFVPIEELTSKYKTVCISPAEELTWAKRKKLNDKLCELVCGKNLPTLKERMYFLKYIIGVYHEYACVRVLEEPFVVNLKSIIASNKFLVTNNQEEQVHG